MSLESLQVGKGVSSRPGMTQVGRKENASIVLLSASGGEMASWVQVINTHLELV